MQSKAQRSFDDEVLDFKWLFNHEQHSSFPMETIFSFFTILEISRDLSCVEMRSKADKTPVARDDISWALKPGARFSKASETFRARKAIAKSRTLRLQSCFIHIF